MEILVPLLIFVVGGIFSFLNDQNEKKKSADNPRNIDFDKLNETYQKKKTDAVKEFKRVSRYEKNKPVDFERLRKQVTETPLKKEVEKSKEKERARVKKAEPILKEIELNESLKDTHTDLSKAFKKEKVSFDKQAVVNGIIMKEVLGQPKSRQKKRVR